MLKVENIARDFLERHGSEVAANVTGVQQSVAESWSDGRSKPPSLQQLSAMLEFDPDPINAIKPLVQNPDLPKGEKLMILMQINRQPNWRTMSSIIKLYDSSKMQFFLNYNNQLPQGRNWLAARFLESNCEWSFWADDDMVYQCGDADWFKRATKSNTYPDVFAGINTIGALVSNKKTLVGGLYFARQESGRALYADAFRSNDDNESAHRGPRMEVKPTKWVAQGCMLVHRKVYLDIVAKGLAKEVDKDDGMSMGYRYDFFSSTAIGRAEDQSFCERAKAAGHQPFVDFKVMPSHVGECSFNYYNTRGYTK